MVDTPGSLTSPRYPDEYLNRLDCGWVLEAQDGYRVKLEFDGIEIEECGSECSCDALKVKKIMEH